MSKNELLDSLRFGADKIFRSKDSSVTEADIDAILEEGRKRTEAMNKAANDKITTAEKGDMYDFKLDGGLGVQVSIRFFFSLSLSLSLGECILFL